MARGNVSADGEDEEPDITGQDLGFLERDWGKKAHILQLMINILTDKHWDMIESDADTYLKAQPRRAKQPKGGTVDDEDDASSYLHAHLIVDW